LLEAERLLSNEADRVGGLRGGILRQRAWRAAQALQGWKPVWFSQAGQDKFLDEQVFAGRRNGFFLDVGGYVGVTGSNTLFFELFRNWDGILSGFDFEEFDVRAWSIENMHGDEAIHDLMARNGYRRVQYIGSDEIYVR
jgi:hypothetical protein